MNKYAAANRILRARNAVYDSTVVGPPPYGLRAMPAPAAGLTILAADCLRQNFILDNTEININSNFRLRRLGVFCNFADGLVFSDGNPRFDLVISAIGATASTPLTGTVTMAPGSVAVAGAGTLFQTEGVGAGSILVINNRYYTVLSLDLVTPELLLYLTDEPKITIGGAGATANLLTLDVASIQTFFYEDLSELNFLYDVEHFFNPANYVAAGTPTDLILTGRLNNNITGIDAHTTDFLTDSIAAAFTGDNLTFDILAEIEFTE